jgi:hypothetical protein
MIELWFGIFVGLVFGFVFGYAVGGIRVARLYRNRP